jgi:mRNA interferase MazF
MASAQAPLRGEIWLADLNPVRGHEQAGRRPVLVVSDSLFNRGPAELTIVLPVTSRLRGIPHHIRVEPPEGGLRQPSAILCDAIRSSSRERLVERWGSVSSETLEPIEDALRSLLGLSGFGDLGTL